MFDLHRKFQLKKKKVKKQWSDKKGSQKEEIGLIENLYSNIKHVQTLIGEIKIEYRLVNDNL